MEKQICTLERLIKFRDDLRENVQIINLDIKKRIIMQLRIWTSLESPANLKIILESNVCSALVQFANSPQIDEKSLLDILWILSNMASGPPDYVKYIADINGDDLFVKHLLNSAFDIIEQCIIGLGNIAAEAPNFRDFLLNSDITIELEKMINTIIKRKGVPISLFDNLAWLLSQLVRGKPPVLQQTVSKLIPMFRQLFYLNEPPLYPNLLWGISYMTDEDDQVCSEIAQSVIFTKVSELLDPRLGFKVNLPALRVMGNLASADDNTTDIIIDNTVLVKIVSVFFDTGGLLENQNLLRKEACWCISNVAAGPLKQLQMLMQIQNFSPILKRNLKDKDPDIMLESMWIVSNLLHNKYPEVISFVMLQDFVQIESTEVEHGDRKMIELYIEVVFIVFEYVINAEELTLQEMDKLQMIVHYVKTSISKIKPVVLNSRIRQDCKKINDLVLKIEQKYTNLTVLSEKPSKLNNVSNPNILLQTELINVNQGKIQNNQYQQFNDPKTMINQK